MPLRVCKVKNLTGNMMIKPENKLPLLPPAVMVHGLMQAKRACAAGLPVTLLSAPDAARAWGCLWWLHLLEAAGHKGPAFLDCGASPGRAVEALTLGLRFIVLSPCAAWAEVETLARQSRAMLLPTAPKSLDLGQKQTEDRLTTWLGG